MSTPFVRSRSRLAMTLRSGKLPEWADMLADSLSKSMKENKDSISYAISTIGEDGYPHSRFVVHRGFVNQRGSETDEGLKNSKDLGVGQAMIFTADIRSEKIKQIAQNRKVELCWWMEPTGHQYRVAGEAFVLAAPGQDARGTTFDGKRLAPSESFDWESERIRVWRKMSPPLRATFCRPKTGVPLEKDDDPESWPTKLGNDLECESDEDKKHLRIALENFALVLIDPAFVDWVSLKDEPNKRAFFKREGGDWKRTKVAP